MKTYIGTVISNKMVKTVVVARVIKRAHPVYKKIMSRRRTIKAHTDIPLAIGAVVKIAETRPISREKHFRVIEKIN